jgi:hypothetical protein
VKTKLYRGLFHRINRMDHHGVPCRKKLHAGQFHGSVRLAIIKRFSIQNSLVANPTESMRLATWDFNLQRTPGWPIPRICGISLYGKFLKTKFYSGLSYGIHGISYDGVLCIEKLHIGQSHESVGLAFMESFSRQNSMVAYSTEFMRLATMEFSVERNSMLANSTDLRD